MGLGLSIARKSAVLSGGEIELVEGRLGRRWISAPPASGMKRILVLDDEPNIRRSLQMILEHSGYAVVTAGALEEAKRMTDGADALLLDVRLPDGNGIDFLKQLREKDFAAPAIMISGHGTIADAVEATRAGAFDFLEKPLSREKVLVTLKNALEQSNLRRENEQLARIGGHRSDE